MSKSNHSAPSLKDCLKDYWRLYKKTTKKKHETETEAVELDALEVTIRTLKAGGDA